MTAILLQLLFLGNMSYLFGSLFKSTRRSHALKVLAVDFDGAEIGSALSAAYESLKGDAFPTIEFKSSSEYPDPESLSQAVCKEGYWGAVYSHAGASDRLMQTIQGNSTEAYQANDTVTFTYVGAYYPIVTTSVIYANLQTLISVASRTFYQVAPDALSSVNLTDKTSAMAFLNPIQASVNAMGPMQQGTRALLNTVTMVMPALMQFFFLMAVNGIMGESGVLAKHSKRDVYVMRLLASKIYTCVCGLVTTGYIWAYREDWAVDGGYFAETWMCLWFYADISYVIIDTVLGTMVPMKFMSFFVLTWILTNITSTIYPFELSAGFYRVGYALPAHNIWSLLMAIWSNGCKVQNEVALPVCFAWWVVGHVTSAWSVRRRCLMAEQEASGMLDLASTKQPSMTSQPERQAALSRSSSLGSGRTATGG